MAAYVLPEYGLNNPRMTPAEIFNVLHTKFNICEIDTKYMLLDAYFKIAVHIKNQMNAGDQNDENLRTINNIMNIYNSFVDNIDVELQKRSFEYKFVL